MIERTLAPALTFAVLLGGHIAIVSALLAGPTQPSQALSQTATAAATHRHLG